MNQVVSDKLQKIIDAGVNPDDAGYETIDLHTHFSDEDLQPREKETPDADKLAKMGRKRRNNLRKLYNQFEKKDMSFEAFCKEFETLSNPELIRRDAQMLVMQRRYGNRNKQRIDAALRN